MISLACWKMQSNDEIGVTVCYNNFSRGHSHHLEAAERLALAVSRACLVEELATPTRR